MSGVQFVSGILYLSNGNKIIFENGIADAEGENTKISRIRRPERKLP